MRVAVPVIGTLFLLAVLAITVRRLTAPEAPAGVRRELWANLLQILAAAIFVALTTWSLCHEDHLNWWCLGASGFSCAATVATLVRTRQQRPIS